MVHNSYYAKRQQRNNRAAVFRLQIRIIQKYNSVTTEQQFSVYKFVIWKKTTA
jgi:hypothetical protein